MQFARRFVVVVTLIGTICQCHFMVDIRQSNEPVELEEAGIKILMTCYANHDKTVILLGDFPENFIKRLSSHENFALVLINDQKRAENVGGRINRNRKHKAYVVVASASYHRRMNNLLGAFTRTLYYNSMASILVLGWSPQTKYAMCDGVRETARLMVNVDRHRWLNLKLMCRHRTDGLVLFNSNAFTNQIPEPWQSSVIVYSGKVGPDLHVLTQKYRQHDGMCKNLDFDKTRNWGGTTIEFSYDTSAGDLVVADTSGRKKPPIVGKLMNERRRRVSRMDIVDWDDANIYFDAFLKHVNATSDLVTRVKIPGDLINRAMDKVELRQGILKSASVLYVKSYTYPLQRRCSFIVTQFRGNKSQLRKIIDVIDRYSWFGMYAVYAITLIFFKYFLRQTVIEGMLNLVRLTSNFGLTTLPREVASQIYLSCLLFFVVTMQGIFVGNLAALLTEDIPVQQVNNIQHLIEMGYTVRADINYLPILNRPELKGRVIVDPMNDNCIPYVQRDPLVACIWIGSDNAKAFILSLDLYVSNECFEPDYIIHLLPWGFALEQRLHKVMASMNAGGIVSSFRAMVYRKRVAEAESQIIEAEPRVLKLNDLAFAFRILGVGLVIAFVAFIIEIIVHRFHRRVKTTRVIALR